MTKHHNYNIEEKYLKENESKICKFIIQSKTFHLQHNYYINKTVFYSAKEIIIDNALKCFQFKNACSH